jgi:hypothetical protein
MGLQLGGPFEILDALGVASFVARAEQDGVGLVIANDGAMFSGGANLMLVATAIAEGAYDEIALSVKSFQRSGA